MSELQNSFDVVSCILSYASINTKSIARRVCKLWKEAAETELRRIRVVYADLPVSINDDGYLMRLLPFMEKEEYSLYYRYNGNQLDLKKVDHTSGISGDIFRFLYLYCPNLEGFVCNTHIDLNDLLLFAEKLRFLQCLSVYDWSRIGSYYVIKKKSSQPLKAFHTTWQQTWSSRINNNASIWRKFKSLESIQSNMHHNDFRNLVRHGVPLKAIYCNFFTEAIARENPGIKYLDYRVAPNLGTFEFGRIEPLNFTSLIQLDVSLFGGKCLFNFPNLKRVNILINNPTNGEHKISDGFLRSIRHSKRLEYIKFQVLNMELDHLDFIGNIIHYLPQLTDLYIINVAKGRLTWTSHDLDPLINSIVTCGKLRRLHLEFLGIWEIHIYKLASSLDLARLVIENFTPDLIATYITNMQPQGSKVLTLLDSTNSYHRMTKELHYAILRVLMDRRLNVLTCHVKFPTNIDTNRSVDFMDPGFDRFIKSIGYREEWRPDVYKLTNH